MSPPQAVALGLAVALAVVLIASNIEGQRDVPAVRPGMTARGQVDERTERLDPGTPRTTSVQLGGRSGEVVEAPTGAADRVEPARRTAPVNDGKPRPAVRPKAGGSTRPFTEGSAWNSPIPAHPTLDPAGRAMIQHLSGGPSPGIADLYEYGVPVWEGDFSTPSYRVECTKPWGDCPLEKERVPLPPEAAPSRGSDGAMVVVDSSSGKAYEFWQYRWNNGHPTTSWGGVVSVSGEGTSGAAVGAGVSRLAGVVRVSEVVQGRIDHALVFSTDNACGSYRYPASKSDGRSRRPNCIPEGARIQLDPAIDVGALPGLTRGERIVARALQTYGAYNIDNGGARMAFIFETPSGEKDPYAHLGFDHDYFRMKGIPWSRLRVLASWDGSAANT